MKLTMKFIFIFNNVFVLYLIYLIMYIKLKDMTLNNKIFISNVIYCIV